MIRLGRGGFAFGPRPRGGDWLETDLQVLKYSGFTLVTSLLTPPEARELELEQEGEGCQRMGLEFFSYPIPDMTVPADRAAFQRFANEVFGRIHDQGALAYCHCRAGLGRAPLLACSLLVRSGMSSSESWTLLSERRGQPVPETDAQRKWFVTTAALSLDDALRQAGQQEKTEACAEPFSARPPDIGAAEPR